MTIGATTRVTGVIGDPIRHSRSPRIFNAAYAAAELDWVYLAFEVPAGLGANAVRAMPALGIAGLSVTMPHKDDAAAACNELSPDAKALGAVNAIVLREDGSLYGDSTDGEGFWLSLSDAGVDPTGRSVLVLGAGGAARSVVLALGRRGVQVTVAARRSDAAEAAAALAPGARAAAWSDVGSVVSQVEGVVNATSIGMTSRAGEADESRELPAVGAGQWAADLVYYPERTRFLEAAESGGALAVGGLGMLVHQAAIAFAQFTGRPAPLDAMWTAARG